MKKKAREVQHDFYMNFLEPLIRDKSSFGVWLKAQMHIRDVAGRFKRNVRR